MLQKPFLKKSLPQEKQSTKGRSARLHIFVALSIVVVPLLGFSVILLTLVWLYRVKNSRPSSSFLNLSIQDDEPSVYYIDVSAPTFVLLASLSSSVAPCLVTFLMTLLSYSISRKLLDLTENGRLERLPTSYQLVTMIALLNGSLFALWKWLKSTIRFKKLVILRIAACGLLCAYGLVYEFFFGYLSDTVGR